MVFIVPKPFSPPGKRTPVGLHGRWPQKSPVRWNRAWQEISLFGRFGRGRRSGRGRGDRSRTVLVDLLQNRIGDVVSRIGVEHAGNSEQGRARLVEDERGALPLGNVVHDLADFLKEKVAMGLDALLKGTLGVLA